MSDPHEFLVFNKVSFSSISNYISEKLLLLGLNNSAFSDQRIVYFTTALRKHAFFKVNRKVIIDLSMLKSITEMSDFIYMGVVIKQQFSLLSSVLDVSQI